CDNPRRPEGVFPDDDRRVECTHQRNSGNPRQGRDAYPHTTHTPRGDPIQLRARSSVQRPYRLRILCCISCQESAELGLLRRFCFLRVSSAFCQSCTGTSSGVDAMSSQRSSTNWSFSDRLNSKIDSTGELMGSSYHSS